MRHVCNTPVIGISSMSMSILQRPAAEEESAMDMIERLLSGTNKAEMDPFTIKVLLKLARAEEEVKIAQQESLDSTTRSQDLRSREGSAG